MFRRSFQPLARTLGAGKAPSNSHKFYNFSVNMSADLTTIVRKSVFRNNSPRALISASFSSKPEGEPSKVESASTGPDSAKTTKGGEEAANKDIKKFDMDSEDDYYEPQTPREKVTFSCTLRQT
jgi:hypothetical protein